MIQKHGFIFDYNDCKKNCSSSDEAESFWMSITFVSLTILFDKGKTVFGKITEKLAI